MSQPDWECIGQLGDVNPLDYGGYWIFRDKTGVYPEEGELLVVSDEEDGTNRVYRFILERCTYQNGILSDNKFHPDHPAWFAKPEAYRVSRPQDTTYLSGVSDFADYPLDELIQDFCSEDALKRASAYRVVGEYHGFENLDSDPLDLRNRECKQRYKQEKYLKSS